MFKLDEKLIIDQSWVIRHDGNYVVLYKVDASEAKTWILPICTSYIFALVNGENTYNEIIEKIMYIFGIDYELAKDYLNKTLCPFEDDIIVRPRKADDCWNIFDTRDYFIPCEKYHFPVHSRLNIPTKINLFTTKKCCADCIYCYADRRSDRKSELLSLVDWKEIIDEALKFGIWKLLEEINFQIHFLLILFDIYSKRKSPCFFLLNVKSLII